MVEGENLGGRRLLEHINAYELGARQAGRWVLAIDLRAGDRILRVDGVVSALDRVTIDETDKAVYNFRVFEFPNDAVGECGVLVHHENTSVQGSPNNANPVPIEVSEQSIRQSLQGADLQSQQVGGASIPVIERYVRRLEAGDTPPAINVDRDLNMIVDCVHRYIAGRLFGEAPPIQDWPGGNPSRIVPWDQFRLSPKDWGNK